VEKSLQYYELRQTQITLQWLQDLRQMEIITEL